MNPALCALPMDAGAAERLGAALGLPLHIAPLHRFPDGEGLPTAPIGDFDPLIIFGGLDHPDAKIAPLLLLADGARRAGARRLILVAPYMPYLRQDAVFHPGQPISRDVIGRLLGQVFDQIVTVQPHLHRTHSLRPVMAPAKAMALSAAPALAAHIGGRDDPLIVGPDSESGPWARSVAARLSAQSICLLKTRSGDRDVRLSLPPGADVAGRRAVLIDDICSTGQTLKSAVRLLRAAGAASVEIVVVHALVGDRDLAAVMSEGVASFASTDSCPHPSNSIPLAPLIARQLRKEIACQV